MTAPSYRGQLLLAVGARAITLTGDEVRAVLAGKKTQLRRLIWPPPVGVVLAEACSRIARDRHGNVNEYTRIRHPFGPYPTRVSLLFVRETWKPDSSAAGPIGPTRGIRYQADASYQERPRDLMLSLQGRVDSPWRSAAVMPRWASRLLLRLVQPVVAERIQHMADHDAVAEAVLLKEREASDGSDGGPSYNGYTDDPLHAFQRQWDRLYGDRAMWKSNPYVWKLVFERVNP